jgi:DNA invertase Pin-like site-specific DNA recombinase
MGEIYGYARISTVDQNHHLQFDALVEAGVPKGNIVQETISGGEKIKPKFEALLGRLKSGDRLVVWKVDRLGRNAADALETAERLKNAGVRIVVTTLGVDLTTPAGRLVFLMLSGTAEFEKELIRERVTAGLAATKARGTVLGRKNTLTTHQRREAVRMVLEEGKSLATAAATFGCARSIVHRAVMAARTAP